MMRHFCVFFTDTHPSFSNHIKAGHLNALGVGTEPHVAEHHDRTEQQGCGISFVLPRNVWGSSVYLHSKGTHVLHYM